MQTVNIHEAKTQLSRFIDQATLGESIIIARAGRPVARLMPLEATKQVRQLGLGKAMYTLPANFDGLHGDEIQTMFEANK
ncbi:MAG: type II toxin-antitoxin system Phd/YefM family antitoxin [Methylophilaceae bacterium]